MIDDWPGGELRDANEMQTTISKLNSIEPFLKSGPATYLNTFSNTLIVLIVTLNISAGHI